MRREFYEASKFIEEIGGGPGSASAKGSEKQIEHALAGIIGLGR
jgi:hypothetical protein